MPVIFGILWYQIQVLRARVFPPQEFTIKVGDMQENNKGRYVIATVRDKKTKKIVSKTRVFLLADECDQ